MIIPKTESRIFDTFTLENGIKTINVQDKYSDKTIVSVAVSIGSLANPKDYQGLAHFLEHMLFLGSKKYPDENKYERELKKYGGSSNAYTDHFETVYYFSAFNDGIKMIMDIFSRFFIDPLFNEDAVTREINAINNEHLKNINDDHWRQYQLNKNIANKENPYCTFPTGTIETLQNTNLREKMIEFWNTYYVSQNINICIVSNLSITEQQSMLIKTFGTIPKKTSIKFVLPKPIYNKFNITYQMIPLSDIQHLNYYWEVPNDDDYKYNKLFDILGGLITKYDKDSLVNHLKLKGYIESSSYNFDQREGIFCLNFALTKSGINNLKYIDGTLKYTLKKIFEYNWNAIIDYYTTVSEINFNNMEKIDNLSLANKLCVSMQNGPLDEAYSRDFLIQKKEPNIVDKLQPYLNNYFKIVVLPIEKSNIKNIIIDKNYKTEYGLIENIDSELISYNFTINLKNPFLDMNPKLIKYLDCHKIPILIKEKTWYGGCSKFSEPIIKGCFILSNNKFFENEQNYLLTLLSERCLSFYLNQELYNIEALSYNVHINLLNIYNSIIIEYDCPNDPIKFHKFVNLTIDLLRDPIIPISIIKTKIESLKEELSNIINMNPWEYSSYYFSKMSSSNDYMFNKLIPLVDTISVEDINNYIKNLLEGCGLTSFFYGNLNIDQIPKNNYLDKLYYNKQVAFSKIKLLENITINHPNKHEKNNCVSIHYYIGLFIPINWIHAFILNIAFERKFYNILRTKKQLGYLVNMNLSNQGDNYFLVQKIQSEKDCNEVLKEINNFNDSLYQIINEGNLEDWKTSAKNQLAEKDTQIDSIYKRYFSELISKKYLFDRKIMLLEQIEKVSKDSLIKFTKNYILENTNKSIFSLVGNTF